MPTLAHTPRYSGAHGSAVWYGLEIEDSSSFESYLKSEVGNRVSDAGSGFASDLRALATTDMATNRLEVFLNAVPAVESWEIGEALAECVLETETNATICWPWNSVADRRTPRASLPGADLVGFLVDGDEAWFVFGEVKTSQDDRTPPNVMNGSGGMAWQLEQEAIDQSIQRTLLAWLYARCKAEPFLSHYRKAAQRFVQSGLKDFRLYGVLLRDTPHNELDLKSRGTHLGTQVKAPATVTLFAWYLPVKIDQWPKVLKDGGA